VQALPQGKIAHLGDFVRSALKYGAVGLVGFAVDVGVFNALRLLEGSLPYAMTNPLGAKAISVTLSTIVAWLGNRYWTFRHTRRTGRTREFLEFALVAAIGLGISLFCLWISHYVLGFTSLAADNISGNVIGLGLATTFRFLAARYWVFGAHRGDSRAQREDGAAGAANTQNLYAK
jgi:putative flippase GtrA